MKILTCFKVVSDFEHLTPDEALAICKGEWDPNYTKKVWGTYDEAALEQGIRLKESLMAKGRQTTLTAVTVGTCPSRFFTDLFSVSFDKVVQIPSKKSLDFHPDLVAQLLFEYVRSQGGFDVIITGQQASPEEEASVPGRLASLLGIPYLPYIFDVNITTVDELKVYSYGDVGEQEIHLTMPVLLAMENARHPFLRMALLKDRLKASKMKADIYEAANSFTFLNIDKVPIKFVYQQREGSCKFIQAKDFDESMDLLWSEIVKDG